MLGLCGWWLLVVGFGVMLLFACVLMFVVVLPCGFVCWS